MNLTDLLTTKGINLTNITPGNHKTQCPACQASRLRNKTDTPLSIKIAKDLKSAIWNCHHCGLIGYINTFSQEKGKLTSPKTSAGYKKEEEDESNTSKTPGSWDKPRDSGNVIRPDFRNRRW